MNKKQQIAELEKQILQLRLEIFADNCLVKIGEPVFYKDNWWRKGYVQQFLLINEVQPAAFIRLTSKVGAVYFAYTYDPKTLAKRLVNDKTLQTIFPEHHQLHDTIVFDTEAKQYYNKKTDIYLSDDDIAYHKLPVIDDTMVTFKRQKQEFLDKLLKEQYP